MLNNLSKLFETFSDSNLFIFKDQIVTYNDFSELIGSFREDLHSHKLSRDDVVYYYSQNTIEGYALLFALISEKITIVVLSEDLSQQQYEKYCQTVIPTHILRSKDCKLQIEKITENTGVDQLIANVVKRDHSCLILMTSGTTGIPKAIVYDFEKLISRFSIRSKPLVSFPVLQIDHFGGLNTILGIIFSGGTAVLSNNRNASAVIDLIQMHKIELLPSTPTFLKLMLISSNFAPEKLKSLKLITYGTEVMPDSLLRKVHELLPNVKFKQTYGLSEVGVLSTKSLDSKSTFVKLGGAGFKFKIVNNKLWIKSDFAMEGYIGKSSSLDSEGYFNTQDIVEVNEEYVRFLGRDSDIINIGGLKFYPQEVEDVLMQHIDVIDASCLTEKNELAGSIVKAYIVTSETANRIKLKKELRFLCRNNLGMHQIPSKYEFVNELTATKRLKKSRTR